MIERKNKHKLTKLLAHMPAVAILGPRQVGKTTLAQEIADGQPSVYLDLENPADLQKLSDASYYFEQHNDKLIIIDEVQRLPDLFQELRGQIDRNRRNGKKNNQFLLLGSASNKLLNQSSESLAGRVSYQELFGLNIIEAGPENIDNLWLRGGFPDSLLNEDMSFQWRQDFIRTYLERDIPMLGPRIPAQTLQRFWTMLAHNQGQIFNASQLGRNIDVSGPTANRYLDLMVDLMLVRRLPPWHSNVGKRLVKSPKSYIRDSGLLHHLLNIPTLDGLLGHPVVGSSWEAFVIENILSVANGAQAYFYRTSAQAEIDLLLDFGGEIWAIEIKRSKAAKVSKGYYNACEDLKPARKYLVYTGDETYQTRDDICVTSLLHIMNDIIDYIGKN